MEVDGDGGLQAHRVRYSLVVLGRADVFVCWFWTSADTKLGRPSVAEGTTAAAVVSQCVYAKRKIQFAGPDVLMVMLMMR